jgi:hypothetical protein
VTGQQVQALENAKTAGAAQGAIVVAQEKAYNQETVEFKLAPERVG